MAEFKLVISGKEGKTLQKEIKESEADVFIGLKIGDRVEGANLGFEGYEFEIRGGSDYCGFPMRKGLSGTLRKSLLMGKGVGCLGKERKLRKKTLQRNRGGFRRKKTVCSEVIHEKISQINLKILKTGKSSIFEVPATEEAPASE
ncbi:30S ribosomal protein S6e [Candidatus Woesearchaeota archaeon]|nr:30S ribosomal protein S6e [Candidatus Woesearchaeota archaeon]